MAMPDEMNSIEVCEFLGIKPNNLHQITSRWKRKHELLGHKNTYSCACFVVEREGRWQGKKINIFLRHKVVGYSLYRNGQPSDLETIDSKAREAVKLQRPGNTRGRPTNKVKR